MKLYSDEFFNDSYDRSPVHIVQSLLAATFIVALLLGPIGFMAARMAGVN